MQMRRAGLAIGTATLLIGAAFLTPPLIALYVLMRYYTVGFSPWWIPELLIAMALLGGTLVTYGIYVLRGRPIFKLRL
jgi:hypothetical protein